MAKIRAYIRVARNNGGRTPYKVDASVKPNNTPLSKGGYGEFLPTAMFAVDLEIPDIMFERAEEVLATLTIDPEQAEIAAEVS